MTKKKPPVKVQAVAAVQASSQSDSSTHSGSAVPAATSTQNDTANQTAVTPQQIFTGPCSSGATNASSLQTNSHPLLRKLAQYQNVCGQAAITTAMVFSGMPRTQSEADELAADMTATFASFAAAKITPLVIVEPMYGGTKLDLISLKNGALDTTYNYYLQKLKTNGLTDINAGTWVFFPEANLPEWSTIDPTVYAANITKFGSMFKSHFSGAKISVLLDSTTYAVNNYNQAGNRVSLLPYVSSIPAGIVDSFGMQGFPWAAPANATYASSTDAAAFLPTAIAAEAARALGVSDVWFNSGTYSKFYAGNLQKQVVVGASERANILTAIVAQAKKMQLQGFNTNVHIFAEDKSTVAEAVDWSYWYASPIAADSQAGVFANFANELFVNGIGLWVFDSF